MTIANRILAYMFTTLCLGCLVMQAYLQGFYTAQDNVRQQMAQGDWLLTMEIASKGERQ